ncbi:hypothetical protein PQQ63_20320 [Paraburkholderia metrosideri]|uniref:Uncharacterized protein n=1 Tax=Paraburkholderia metrosideri TaxID=580937 RepID=A0ABW9DVI1_9BURK
MRQLGPPLSGDWGAASAMPPLPGGNVNLGPSAENIDRQRQADEIARSAVFFRNRSGAGKPDAASASAGTAQTANATAGAFNRMGAGPASTAARPNDPTAIQNRQDQKEAFMAKGADAATSNKGSLQARLVSRQILTATPRCTRRPTARRSTP